MPVEQANLNRNNEYLRRFAALAALAVLAAALPCSAQQSPTHYPYRASMPPGMVGQAQLRRGGPLPGYFQPVEVISPSGAKVALDLGGQFEESSASRAKAGMLIGGVYRLKVTQIPDHPGEEVYPTVEVINRLYPPPGQEARFPIPIHLSQEELELALNGHYVTRVVYLENPGNALPVREDPAFQRYFEIHPRQDPLQVADELGRPMAILRMGSRVPATDGQGLGQESPPLLRYPQPEELPGGAPLSPVGEPR